jgi:hypothetical protein
MTGQPLQYGPIYPEGLDLPYRYSITLEYTNGLLLDRYCQQTGESVKQVIEQLLTDFLQRKAAIINQGNKGETNAKS